MVRAGSALWPRVWHHPVQSPIRARTLNVGHDMAQGQSIAERRAAAGVADRGHPNPARFLDDLDSSTPSPQTTSLVIGILPVLAPLLSAWRWQHPLTFGLAAAGLAVTLWWWYSPIWWPEISYIPDY